MMGGPEYDTRGNTEVPPPCSALPPHARSAPFSLATRTIALEDGAFLRLPAMKKGLRKAGEQTLERHSSMCERARVDMCAW